MLLWTLCTRALFMPRPNRDIRGFSMTIVICLPGDRLTNVAAYVRLKFMKSFLSGHRVIFGHCCQ